ncbi:hypothetical protein EYF80_013418 [Liparis tanakae]|uniref:Uncharacterized protein n=1 Tax=Liparis tanakae TaxID=230148 RepID=A0A4Z2IE27_9TELE|nr:hypothetical protein EYF80_013418 [Liparis tanakae]
MESGSNTCSSLYSVLLNNWVCSDSVSVKFVNDITHRSTIAGVDRQRTAVILAPPAPPLTPPPLTSVVSSQALGRVFHQNQLANASLHRAHGNPSPHRIHPDRRWISMAYPVTAPKTDASSCAVLARRKLKDHQYTRCRSTLGRQWAAEEQCVLERGIY